MPHELPRWPRSDASKHLILRHDNRVGFYIANDTPRKPEIFHALFRQIFRRDDVPVVFRIIIDVRLLH